MPKPVYYARSGRWVFAPDGAYVIPTGSLNVKPHILHGGAELRHCACCGVWLPLEGFAKGKAYKGLHTFCRICSDASKQRTVSRRRVERVASPRLSGKGGRLAGSAAMVEDAVVIPEE